MKPTAQQKQWLQEYLAQVLTYRETYLEVYDHILSALENQSEREFFETTINEIIATDFGGNNGLMELEESCKNNVVKEVKQRYWLYFIQWLKIPYVVFTILAALSIYFIARYMPIFAVVFVLLFVVPVYLLAVRGFRTGYVFGSTKTAMRDSIFRRIAYKPVWWFFVLGAIGNLLPHNKSHYSYNKTLSIIDFTIMVILLIIHTVTFFKLYKDEFKMSITT